MITKPTDQQPDLTPQPQSPPSSQPPEPPPPAPMDEQPSMTMPPEPPHMQPEDPAAQMQTVVVPTDPNINDVAIGQETVPPPGGGNPNVVPPAAEKSPSGGGFFRKILMFFVIIVLIGLAAVAGKYIMGMIQGNKEVTITYWGLWENESIVRPLIDDFETKNPKIKVNYVRQTVTQYRERLTAAINRGEGPDVFRFHNTWVPMVRSLVDPVPADVITPQVFATTYYPIASNDLVAGNTIYGIPLMIDGLGLYINEDIFAAAGATVPTTWEDVLSLVPLLTVKDDVNITTSAIALGTTSNVEHFSDIIATMMMQNGADLSKPQGTAAEEALIFYRKFSDPTDPVYTWNATLDNSVFAFANGRVAMMLAPSWRAFEVKQINSNTRFKIVPIPQLPGNNVTWASYWSEGVSAKSPNRVQAWEFVKYMTSREAAVKLYTQATKYRAFGEPYARVDLAKTLENDPYVAAYILQAEKARSFPLASRTFDNGLNDKLIKYLEDAVNSFINGNSPAAVLETASAGFTQVLGQYGLSTAAAPVAQ